MKQWLQKFWWLYSAKPTSLQFNSLIAIVIICFVLGYLISYLSADSMELGSYLALSFIWLFGIILFTDFGGHFNDTQKHLTFWMNFFPSKLTYLFTLSKTFALCALLYSTMGVLGCFLIDVFLMRSVALTPAVFQGIIHQTLALTVVAWLSHGLGAWLSSGMRQMLCLSLCVIIFFLSSIIPYFFSFNDVWMNLVFEIIPRIDLYDNRNSLFVALAPYPWSYTFQIALYALGQTLLFGVITWARLLKEGWK